MRSKKKLIISIIAIIAITVVLIMVLVISKEQKEKKNNMEIIEKNYKLLSESVKSYNEIREKYSEMSLVLLMDNYKDKHEEFVKLFDDYNKDMENIDNYITNINVRCGTIYKKSEVNKICSNYKSMYEKLVNLYISDVDNHNDFIKKYNESKNEELELIDMVHERYIDYDEDGMMYGGDDVE